MALNYAQLVAYIDGLYADGSLSEQDYNDIIVYILANGDVENAPRDLIQVRRGNEAEIPNLAQGEVAFTLDKENLFIGGMNGNVNLSKSKIDIYSVKNYGAKGDGINDDRQAIQDAINDCAANGGGIVYLPPNKTYLLNSHTRMFTYNITSVKMMLELKDNVVIMGSKNATLKIANNYTDGGDYVVFGAERVDNLTLSGFTLDQNGQNNTVIDSAANVRRAYGVRIYKGKNILIDGITINESPGRNVINIGDFAAYYETENVTVRNCIIKNVGGAVQGNSNQSDHSTLYLQAKTLNVHDNYLMNDYSVIDPAGLPQYGLTAIEIHEGGNVFRNRVENYHLGMYCANYAFEGEKYHAYNNYFKVTRTGYQLWVEKRMRDVILSDNIVQVFGFAQTNGIFQYDVSNITKDYVENLVIKNNIINFENAPSDVISAGMVLTAVKNGIIEGNSITGCSGSAINISPPQNPIDIDNIKIVNNVLTDYGFNTVASTFWGVYLLGKDTSDIKNVVIDNNVFNNYKTLVSQRGIRISSGYIDNVIVGNLNQFINLQLTVDQLNTTNHTNITINSAPLYGTLQYNPPSLIDGAGATSPFAAISGVNFGDFVQVSAPYDLQGCVVTGYVVAHSLVKLRVQNNTGATVDLADGLWKFKVTK